MTHATWKGGAIALLAGTTVALMATPGEADSCKSSRWVRGAVVAYSYVNGRGEHDGQFKLTINRGSNCGLKRGDGGVLKSRSNKYLLDPKTGKRVWFEVTDVRARESTAYTGNWTSGYRTTPLRTHRVASITKKGGSSQRAPVGRTTARTPSPTTGTCQPTTPRASGIVRQCATGKRTKVCAAYDARNPATLQSNLCMARTANANLRDAMGRPVDYSEFGKVDCRVYDRRQVDRIERVVVHNGGLSAAHNTKTWECREAAAHYSIERDGRIFQHVGEEKVVPHVLGDNRRSIGVEMIMASPKCNNLSAKESRDAAVVKRVCEPTAAQYTSLRNLIRAIAKRTRVDFVDKDVVGHCEVDGNGDPKAFNWTRIGLSNAARQTPKCKHYWIYPAD